MTAGKLGVSLGDRVDGCFFLDGAMKLRRFTVSGIYTSNFGDYDRLTGYADISMLQKLRGLESTQGDVIEIRGLAIDEIADATQQLQKSLGARYDNRELTDGVSVATLFDSGAMYFNWLALLDANVVVILIIMSLVSGFTLISCVFILILQRVRMIGVLKSLGATNRQIRRVFMLLGLRVVGLGLLIGNCVGIALLLLQAHFHLLPLDPDSYYLTYVPVLLDWRHVLLLNAGAVVLAGMLLLIPASLVSRISPAKTMHYE
jgi:lipoprotein-releasing system permease protein